MSFIDKIWIKFGKKQIGTDLFGNKYFVGKGANYLGKLKRFVIYNGCDESSKVPPMWHAWLHYMSDDVPTSEDESYDWQQSHAPNLTGTKHAYNPKAENNDLKPYLRWTPNN